MTFPTFLFSCGSGVSSLRSSLTLLMLMETRTHQCHETRAQGFSSSHLPVYFMFMPNSVHECSHRYSVRKISAAAITHLAEGAVVDHWSFFLSKSPPLCSHMTRPMPHLQCVGSTRVALNPYIYSQRLSCY